jgi:antitoxin VapB
MVYTIEVFMTTAKLIKNGRSQAVRLPKEFRLPGDEVYVKRIGNAVVLIPMNDPWGLLNESLAMFSDYPEERTQPADKDREEL